MDFVKFNNTDLIVSPVCLGTVNYGTAMPKKSAKEQISQFLDLGGNFIDTAHVYGDWEPDILCRSERVIGEWFKESGQRGNVILCTKGGHPDLKNMSSSRLTPKDIEKDLNESLQYLNTDFIDLYFLHRDDPKIPVSNILDCLEDFRDQGKIRYYSCSNWPLERIKLAHEYALTKGISGFICNQLMWSLADINFDGLADKTFVTMDSETYKYHEDSGFNAMAYMSIAKGYFTRRLNGEKLPRSVKDVYENESNDKIYRKISNLESTGNTSIMNLSLTYIMMHSFPSVPIASFDSFEQLREGMSTCSKIVSKDLIQELHNMKKLVYKLV